MCQLWPWKTSYTRNISEFNTFKCPLTFIEPLIKNYSICIKREEKIAFLRDVRTRATKKNTIGIYKIPFCGENMPGKIEDVQLDVMDVKLRYKKTIDFVLLRVG